MRPLWVVLLLVVKTTLGFQGEIFKGQQPDLFSVDENPKLRSEAWLRNVASLPRSRMLRRVGSHLTFTGLWTVSVVALNYEMPGLLPTVDAQPVQIVSTCITIMLGFRTNQSYDRFWEGRNAWSEIWASCRSISRIGATYYAEDPQLWEATLALVATFPKALVAHLRNQTDTDNINDIYETFLSDNSPHKHLLRQRSHDRNVPVAILDDVSKSFRDLRRRQINNKDEFPVANLEQHLDRLSRALCACERIVMTPVPPSYTRHTSRVTTRWSLCLPFCFDQREQPFVVVLSVLLVSWALYTLEEIGKVIEEPFGSDAEDLALDLPLDNYATLIAQDVMRSVY